MDWYRLVTERLCKSSFLVIMAVAALSTLGCETQKGKLVASSTPDRVGSHRAGSEVYDPAAEAAVAGLLSQAASQPITLEEEGGIAGQLSPSYARKVCFVGVENAGGEEMGDIREDLAETIRTMISQSAEFELIDSRLVTAGLRETGLRVDDLLLPEKRSRFASALGEMDAPFDYILFAKVTTATTRDNRDSQVKYSLTLDLVNVHTSGSLRQTVELKKHYNRSLKAKLGDMF
ncbi:MAG: hypothetical protein IJU03_02165 [Thermoguttaceae bacterium]|nr:hypothetical protein [Thermoguttaceae bacterium]